MLKMMCRCNFSETFFLSSRINMNSIEVSVEDQKFLNISERKTVKKDDHYVFPLSFRDENQVVSSNRFQALRRLKFLKRIILKDKSLSRYYKNIMNYFLIK